ncbi:MAG: type II toxin-antitoxin system HicB family antitoxin [Proteobacteria bacterium]|nr:type II toxin-antitoxin system HicB family antitoxin [Pseudomonadota bacterium]
MKQTDNKMKIYNYTVIFKPIKEGGYDVIILAIPEICTFGDTIEESREMAKDAIKCYIESALELNEPIQIEGS